MRWIALLATTAVLLLMFAPMAVAANEPLLAPRADKPLPAPSVRKALPPPHPDTIRAFAAMISGRLAPERFGIHLRSITTKNSRTPAASAAPTRKVVLKFPQSSPQRSQRPSTPPAAGTPTSLAKQATAAKAETKPVVGCPTGGCSTRGSWQGIFRRRGG